MVNHWKTESTASLLLEEEKAKTIWSLRFLPFFSACYQVCKNAVMLSCSCQLDTASVTCEERTQSEELCPLRNFVNFIWHRKAHIITGSAIFTQLGLHLVRKYLHKQEQAVLWAFCFHLLPQVSFVWIPLKTDYNPPTKGNPFFP